jgi:hypothetical protein
MTFCPPDTSSCRAGSLTQVQPFIISRHSTWRCGAGTKRAYALVRAGADICLSTVTKSLAPEEGMGMFDRLLRLAVRCTGTRLHLLEEAANASAAAVGPRTAARSCAPLQEIPAKWRQGVEDKQRPCRGRSLRLRALTQRRSSIR